MRQLISATVAGLVATGVTLVACANPGLPPGAPERHAPPEVVGAIPDTNATRVRAREVVIEFDAVISERPAAANATGLSDLIIVSPRRGEVDVRWRRDYITVRPKRGWRANTTYTVSLLPGIADLQGNVRKDQFHLVFSTGDTIAQGMIRGTVFDWMLGKPTTNTVVEAVPHPDTSIIYTSVTDSLGNFTLRVPERAQYTVRASINTTKERIFDSRMAWDSTALALQDSARLELLAFTHDTIGPQLGVVRYEDSVTLRAVFGVVIDPTIPLELSQFSLTTKDGTPVSIKSVTPSTLFTPEADTMARTRGADTGTMRARDTIPERKPTKPLLFREVVIVVTTPLQYRTEYILRATNLRSPSGDTASSERSFTTPAPPPPPEPKDTTVKRQS